MFLYKYIPFNNKRYERIEEIIWVKTNQLQRIIRTGRTGTLFCKYNAKLKLISSRALVKS